MISVTDGENHQVKYRYNTSGGIISQTDECVKVLLSYDYDLNGNYIQQSENTGKSITYTYNVMDLLEEIHDNMSSMKCTK